MFPVVIILIFLQFAMLQFRQDLMFTVPENTGNLDLDHSLCGDPAYLKRYMKNDGRRDNMKEYLVFDWGGTFLKYALMDEETKIHDIGKVSAPSRESTKEEFMELIDSIVQQYLEKISGIAISSPGILDSRRGVIHVVGVFPYLNETYVKIEMEKRYRIPVALENDGRSAALAELWKGSLAGCRDGAVVILGTAVGGGLILDGKLRRGQNFFAGEFSGACMNVYDTKNEDSYWGSLGYRGLTRRIEKRTGEEKDSIDGEEAFRRIIAGDENAKEALKEYTDLLALEIFSLNLTLDLEKICIGGGISRQPALIESLRQSVRELADIHPDLLAGTNLPLPKVDVCSYYNEANLVGALYHLLFE